MLKAKDREMECLLTKLSEKDELLRKYGSQIEDLKKDIKNKCRKYQEVVNQLKVARNEDGKVSDDVELNVCENEDLGELVNEIMKIAEDQRKSVAFKLQNAECQLKTLTAEKKMYIKERNEITSQLQCLISENERLVKEVANQKKSDCEKDELLKTIDALKIEKNELFEKVNTLHENIQEINHNFKETRWALTSEVAEKHDQVQELKRCVGILEEQLRQADMQTHFKDDIIKELRKELKASRKSLSSVKNSTKILPHENSNSQLISLKPTNPSTAPKKGKDDDLKVDIHIFPINELRGIKADHVEEVKFLNFESVETQTEPCRIPSPPNMRNVSTQHKINVQKLPRSFGTLTVTPWSGAAGEIANGNDTPMDLNEAKKNLKGIYTVPFSEV